MIKEFKPNKNIKPNKAVAKAILEFTAMDEGKIKENLKILCEKEISKYTVWLNYYCRQHKCTQEEALNNIISNAH